MNNEDQGARLREFIEGAVGREVSNQIVNLLAPLREAAQIARGNITQINRDIGAMQSRLAEQQDMIIGNPRLRLRGLQAEVQDVSDKLSTLLKERDALLAEIRGGRKVLYFVGALASFPFLQQLGLFHVIAKLLGLAP